MYISHYLATSLQTLRLAILYVYCFYSHRYRYIISVLLHLSSIPSIYVKTTNGTLCSLFSGIAYSNLTSIRIYDLLYISTPVWSQYRHLT